MLACRVPASNKFQALLTLVIGTNKTLFIINGLNFQRIPVDIFYK